MIRKTVRPITSSIIRPTSTSLVQRSRTKVSAAVSEIEEITGALGLDVSGTILRDLSQDLELLLVNSDGNGLAEHDVKSILTKRMIQASKEKYEDSSAGRVFLDAFVLLPVKYAALRLKQGVHTIEKGELADYILLLVCSSPDDAEEAVGDLLEQFEDVKKRKPKWFSDFWFYWQMFWLVLAKARKRLVKATLGPLLDKWFKPNL